MNNALHDSKCHFSFNILVFDHNCIRKNFVRQRHITVMLQNETGGLAAMNISNWLIEFVSNRFVTEIKTHHDTEIWIHIAPTQAKGLKYGLRPPFHYNDAILPVEECPRGSLYLKRWTLYLNRTLLSILSIMASDVNPDSKVHGANMGPIWVRQDPGGPLVGPMNLVIWVPL